MRENLKVPSAKPMHPERRNQKALNHKKRLLGDDYPIRDLLRLPPYFGWVNMGKRDLYMYLNGADDGVALRWFWLDSFEKASTEIWEKLSTHFNQIIDIGAHTGCYSLIAAKAHSKAKITAIEPMPLNIARLAMNKYYNMLKNIQIVPGAAYDKTKVLQMNTFRSLDYCLSGQRVKEPTDVQTSKALGNNQVQGYSLDDLALDHSTKTLIKIDTEGCEDKVLCGASKLLKSKPWILCEATNQQSSEAITRLLKAYDYSFYVINNKSMKLFHVESVEPLYRNGKPDLHMLNRLLIPREQISSLQKILSR